MNSDYQRVALGARMVHFTTLFVGAFALFLVWDWVLRQWLPVHTIPSSLTLGYVLSLLVVSCGLAALLAQFVEYVHMRIATRRRRQDERLLFRVQVRHEYTLLASCAWYRYALRSGWLGTFAAMYAFAAAHNIWCSLYISFVSVVGCLAIMRTR